MDNRPPKAVRDITRESGFLASPTPTACRSSRPVARYHETLRQYSAPSDVVMSAMVVFL